MKDLLCQIRGKPLEPNGQFWKCAQMKNEQMKTAGTKDLDDWTWMIDDCINQVVVFNVHRRKESKFTYIQVHVGYKILYVLLRKYHLYKRLTRDHCSSTIDFREREKDTSFTRN